MTEAAVEVGDVIVETDVALEEVMEEAIDFWYAGSEDVVKETIGLEADGLEAVGLEAIGLEAVATTVGEVLEAGAVGSFEQDKRCLASSACDLKK
jgi:hypothetical protein